MIARDAGRPEPLAGRQTATRPAADAPERTLPHAATIAILATMLGVAVGLLLALARTPSPPAVVRPAAAEESAMPAKLAPWPTWPSSLSVDVAGGELVMILATETPEPVPTVDPASVPTSTPPLPDCGERAVPGAPCEWPRPTRTPTPVVVCETPVPGESCLWPTPAGPAPTPASIPSPP